MMSSFAFMREGLGIMYRPGRKAGVFCCPSIVAQGKWLPHAAQWEEAGNDN
jgi:hypothetical protein